MNRIGKTNERIMRGLFLVFEVHYFQTIIVLLFYYSISRSNCTVILKEPVLIMINNVQYYTGDNIHSLSVKRQFYDLVGYLDINRYINKNHDTHSFIYWCLMAADTRDVVCTSCKLFVCCCCV